MMKKLLFSFICTIWISHLSAQIQFSSMLIPEELKKNANAVIRYSEDVFDIESPGKAIYSESYAITVLNEKGDDWAEFYRGYDKHRKILSAEGFLYDGMGKQLKKVRLKDMSDFSATSDINLIDDSRVKHHNFGHTSYPYTVEYKVKTEFTSTMFFPNFAPLPGTLVSTEKSSFIVNAPSDYLVRYKTFNVPFEPSIKTVGGKKQFEWKFASIPAIRREIFSPPLHEKVPYISFAPSKFKIDNYEGDMTSWADFGKFIHALREGRDNLPEATRAKVKEIASQHSTDKEKVAALYKYLQKNTRYISIQLGIGGFQPFDAKDVAEKAYGDCKALTNYMATMLKEVNIPSYYAVIRAGENERQIQDDFPSQQFNHVILCVPLQKDTMWLECTSQTLPPGYLSGFTSDRYALLVDEKGGKLVRTPYYGLNDNIQSRHIKGKVDLNGHLKVQSKSFYKGAQQDDLHQIINALTKEQTKKYLKNEFDLATYEINNFKYEERHDGIPSIEETLDLDVSNYATVSGKRLFVLPNIMTRLLFKPSMNEERKDDIWISSEFIEIDSVQIEIPEGYTIESSPKDETISSQFGKYSSKTIIDGNTIVYYRRLESYKGKFKASEFKDFYDFYNSVYKADRTRVVLVKS